MTVQINNEDLQKWFAEKDMNISKKEIEKTIQTLLDFDNASLFVYGSNPSKTLKDKIEKIQTGIKIRKPLKKEQNQC